jgi:hypothetical protein
MYILLFLFVGLFGSIIAPASEGYAHPDLESYFGAHLLFSFILVKALNYPRNDSDFLYEARR